MFGLSKGTCRPNLKSIASKVLELLAFNNQKFMWAWPQPVWKFLKGHDGTISGNIVVKFGVRRISHFNNVVQSSYCTQDKNVKQKQDLHHSLRSLAEIT